MTSRGRTPSEAVQQTTCCVVGGGPGGAILALLLARRGVRVTLLERHGDFDRDFRGDTVHPATMEIMDQLGLAGRLLEIPHSKIRVMSLVTPSGTLRLADLGRLRTRYPYVTMMPQVRFLEFVTREAARYPEFELIMGARAQELLVEEGVVRGVRYRTRDGEAAIRAALTVGADGRFSTVRKLADLETATSTPPIDVVWFRLPREPDDPAESGAGYLRAGRAMVLLDRGAEWQIAFVILKGTFHGLKDAGIEAFRREIAATVPMLAGRVELLSDWKQVTMLSVAASRLPRWYRPGLLLIGDAAHVMSPVGGVGINYAIQDAVEAANVLTAPLKDGRLRTEHLAQVQRRREWPTKVIQAMQAMVLRRIIAAALQSAGPVRLPIGLRLISRIPGLRNLPGYMIAFGVRRARLEPPPRPASSFTQSIL